MSQINPPVVSVVIPCFNHARYLSAAVESVRRQTYLSVEILVVDDGSTDNTTEVCSQWSDVKYIFQKNQGLSASRNTGIGSAIGEFLIFLDADDTIFPNAVEDNLSYLLENPALAFVSGGHEKNLVSERKIKNKSRDISGNFYCELLQGNYIAMIASVMFRRSVMHQYKFDVALKACEDYDIYLRIARNHPVFHHTKVIACYNIYGSNMSGNIPLMLDSALKALKKQKDNLKAPEERICYNNGLQVWKKYFCNAIQQKAANTRTRLNWQEKILLFQCSKKVFIKYLFT